MTKAVDIISVPLDLGVRERGLKLGPDSMREARIIEVFRHLVSMLGTAATFVSGGSLLLIQLLLQGGPLAAGTVTRNNIKKQ